MKQIAQVLLFDRNHRLLIYLRDDKPEIPFPNHWDFFGGHLEKGETPEQALVREVNEELGVELTAWQLFRIYNCDHGDVYPNVKHIYWTRIDKVPQELMIKFLHSCWLNLLQNDAVLLQSRRQRQGDPFQ